MKLNVRNARHISLLRDNESDARALQSKRKKASFFLALYVIRSLQYCCPHAIVLFASLVSMHPVRHLDPATDFRSVREFALVPLAVIDRKRAYGMAFCK